MPVYAYDCPKPGCFGRMVDMRSIDERHEGPLCHCGTPMELRITPVFGVVKNPAVPRSSK